MEKKKLRQQQISRLKVFADSDQKRQEDRRLLMKLLKSPLIRQAQTIGVTSSLPFEVDTAELIAVLWDEGKSVFLARVNPNIGLEFAAYTYHSQLKRSSFGIEEVADPQASLEKNPDLLIVPGLAFAQDTGARLGFGGGYYDRFLSTHHCRTISLVNTVMCFKKATWPIEAHDVAIDHLITV